MNLSFFVSVVALIVSGLSYWTSSSAFRTTVSVHKASVASDLFEAENEYGIATGALVARDGAPKVTDASIHTDPAYRRVLETYHNFRHKLQMYDLTMPPRLTVDVGAVKSSADHVFNVFRNTDFAKLPTVFHEELVSDMDRLRQRLGSETKLP